MNVSVSTLSNLITALYWGGTITCSLVILMMFFRWKERVQGNGLLLFSFVNILFSLLIIYLFDSGAIYHYPHFFRTGHLASVSYMPAIYLYLKTRTDRRSLRWTDGIHFSLLLLFLIDFTPLYLLPAEAKQALLTDGQYHKQFIPYDEGWLVPKYWHYIVGNYQWFVYWLLEIGVIGSLVKERGNDFIKKNWAWLTWMMGLILLHPFLFVPPIGVILFDWSSAVTSFWYNLGFMLIGLLTSYYLIFRPEILHALQDTPEPALVPTDQPSPKSNSPEELEQFISPSLIASYDRQITEFMQTQEAFLRPGYTIREMAENTGIPLHYLSAVINRHYGYHFNDYINQWRIKYLKQRLDQREWKHKTLEALAKESGFSNRTSFAAAFRKHCGITPSDYIRTLKESN